MSRHVNEQDHEALRELCAGHALGVLDPPESSQLDAHLRTGCFGCLQEIDSYRRTVADMGTLLDEEAAPAGAEERFLDGLTGAVAGTTTPFAARPRRQMGRWLLPAAAMLAVASSLWVTLESRREVVQLRAELEAFETTTDTLVPIFDLWATPTAGEGRGRATFDPRSDTWRLFVHDLASPPQGKIYQGWLVTAEGPLNLGTFLPDDSGHAFLALQVAHPEARVQVTLEPAGGSDAPTGPLVFDQPVVPGR